MRKAILLSCSLTLLFAACTLPARPANEGQNTQSSSSAAASSQPTNGLGEEVGEGEPATEELSETGALTERLLATGVLEIGDPAAPLTLLMFTEHHCSYCREFLMEIFPRLKTDFIEAKRLKLEVAMLPLQKYPQSADTALGLICAAAQGAGLAMHTTLFSNPNKSADAILSYTVDLGLNTALLRDCMKSPRTMMLLDSQEAWAQSLNVTVVPAFFLNGEKFIGLPYYADLKGRIDEALKKQKEQEG